MADSWLDSYGRPHWYVECPDYGGATFVYEGSTKGGDKPGAYGYYRYRSRGRSRDPMSYAFSSIFTKVVPPEDPPVKPPSPSIIWPPSSPSTVWPPSPPSTIWPPSPPTTWPPGPTIIDPPRRRHRSNRNTNLNINHNHNHNHYGGSRDYTLNDCPPPRRSRCCDGVPRPDCPRCYDSGDPCRSPSRRRGRSRIRRGPVDVIFMDDSGSDDCVYRDRDRARRRCRYRDRSRDRHGDRPYRRPLVGGCGNVYETDRDGNEVQVTYWDDRTGRLMRRGSRRSGGGSRRSRTRDREENEVLREMDRAEKRAAEAERWLRREYGA